MPVIKKPIQYFGANTWNGSGTSTVTVDLGFQPDFVWIKPRNNVASNANSHILIDSVRGADKVLRSDTAGAEVTESNNVVAFTSTGVTIGDSHNVNKNTTSQYVVWGWKAGGAAVTNNSGTITSQVSASTISGFSIVTYTGTGANATVGHGLGVAPSMLIVKGRDNTRAWQTFHITVGNNRRLLLNTTEAQTGTSAIYWNNTSPTSSVFSIGTDGNCNASSEKYVAYCFAEVAGYSAFGSYTGNGSTDGPFVFTNMRPRFILTKRTDSATNANWVIHDTTRSTYNVAGKSLIPNLANAEDNNEPTTQFDILSNGFKLRTSADMYNGSGATYIYMALAENPFKYSLAR